MHATVQKDHFDCCRRKAKKNGEYLSNFAKKEEIAFCNKTKWMATKIESKRLQRFHIVLKERGNPFYQNVTPSIPMWISNQSHPIRSAPLVSFWNFK
jgi:hypothetical protein